MWLHQNHFHVVKSLLMQRRVSVQKEAFSPLPFVLPLLALKIKGGDTARHWCSHLSSKGREEAWSLHRRRGLGHSGGPASFGYSLLVPCWLWDKGNKNHSFLEEISKRHLFFGTFKRRKLSYVFLIVFSGYRGIPGCRQPLNVAYWKAAFLIGPQNSA